MSAEPESEAPEKGPNEAEESAPAGAGASASADASASAPGAAAATSKERTDEAGLPLDRAPTFDDVRGNDGRHTVLALGCTAVVVLLVLGFWALRAIVFR
jgi:hypothetical protein